MFYKQKILLLFGLVFMSLYSYSQEFKEPEKWAIAVHGGAGGDPKNITKERTSEYEYQLLKALRLGTEMLNKGASSIDVVQAVVAFLEDCPLFNAGKGAVKNIDGIHELDAAIMDGSNLKAGAIAGVRDIKNPIKAARLVMDSTSNVLLIGEGASSFASRMGLEIVNNNYFSTEQREKELKRILQNKEKGVPMGTVGCVALDSSGNLAAATSTGGMSGKKWGRVGDVPIIGAGTYANNNTVAVSGTGHGELWIRRVVAYDISALVEYRNLSLERAVNEVINNKITPMGGSGGGVIAIDKFGNISIVFNTQVMHRAWAKESGEYGVGVLKGEDKYFNKK